MAWKPDYVTTLELKSELKITYADDDAWIALVIGAASRAVDRHCRRQFGVLSAATERVYLNATYRAERGLWVVDVDDLMTTDGLLVEAAGSAVVGTVLLEPRNAAADGRPWERMALPSGVPSSWPTGDREVAVTAKWGWTAVPVAVKAATMLQASRFYSRRDSPYGVAGSPDVGSEVRLLAKVDPDVAVSLADFVRPAVAA